MDRGVPRSLILDQNLITEPQGEDLFLTPIVSVSESIILRQTPIQTKDDDSLSVSKNS